MTPFFTAARDAVRAQLWPLPVIGILLAVTVALGLPHLDESVDPNLPEWLSAWLFGSDADAARALLDSISTSLITVTSLTFSLTVVTLQLASSQFSPRLLRTFSSDLVVQATLAIFLATFSYSLTVLRSVRSDDSGSAFAPRISVTLAFVLTVVSVFGLVLFLAHLVRELRVETMLRNVHDDASATIRLATGARQDRGAQPDLSQCRSDAVHLVATQSGFVTRVDEPELLEAAVRAGAHVRIDSQMGSNVVAGVPIGVAWAVSGHLDPDDLEQLRRDVRAAIHVTYERTATHDIAYGLRQLADVANKALSPGINDPTTAVHALGHISAILCQLAGRDLSPVLLRDGDGHVRVMLCRPNFDELVDAAITQVRRYGAADPQVMGRLFQLLEEIAWHVTDFGPLRLQLERLRQTVAGSDFDDTELAQLANAAVRVERFCAERRQR